VLIYNLCRSYLFPREGSAREEYPFHSTVLGIQNNHRVLEAMYDLFFTDREKLMGNKNTLLVHIFGFPTMVMTNSVENVTYVLKTNYENYGKTGSFKTKFQQLLGDGIFNSDGKQWYGHRKTSAHLFKLDKFRTTMVDTFNFEMNSVLSNIHNEKGQPFDVQSLMAKLTLESIGRIALGVDLGCLEQKTEVPFAKYFDYCTKEINESMVNPLWRLRRYFTWKGWKFYYYIHLLNEFCLKIIRERRQLAESSNPSLIKKSDLLSLYLDKENFSSVVDDERAQNIDVKSSFLEPTDSNLRDVVLNIAIAGRDTTANALSWAFFRLCIHPEQQQIIRGEIFQHIEVGRYSSNFSYEALQKMKYLEAFCMEVLRLHPSVPKEAKIAQNPDTLPDGTKIEKGDTVVFFPWLMGRDKSLWTDPLTFDPTRFLDKPKPSPFVFTAFQVCHYCIRIQHIMALCLYNKPFLRWPAECGGAILKQLSLVVVVAFGPISFWQ
jgi:cytochrome P450